MKKKSSRLAVGVLSAALILGSSTTAFAGDWSTNLKRWSNASEISTLNKTTYDSSYYMNVHYVGSHYDSVQHWIEGSWGGNYSGHTITKEGMYDNPSSSAGIGDKITLNVKNPINTTVTVESSGYWSPK